MPSVPLDSAPGRRLARLLLDVLIRAGLILALVMLCYRIFSPFLVLMVWALILAVTLYPLHQTLAARLGGRQGLAATLITLLGVVLIVAPTAVLLNSLGDSVHRLIDAVQQNTLQVPAPRPGVAEWPVVGTKTPRLLGNWRTTTCLRSSRACSRRSVNWQRRRWRWWPASAAACSRSSPRSSSPASSWPSARPAIAPAGRSSRASSATGAATEFAVLSVATIRAVAQGVIGIAFIQAILVGLCLLVAGVPLAGVLAVVVLVLGIAQVPALIVTLPAIAYIWMSGDYGTGEAALYSVLLFVAGMVDNVLKPLMLGRGVDAPMPVILLGALGGMAAAGILGMFVGARAAGARLSDLHGLGGCQPRGETTDERQRRDRGRLNSRAADGRMACAVSTIGLPGSVLLAFLVGAIGLEPTTPTMSRWCSNQLSYAPAKAATIASAPARQRRRTESTPGTRATCSSTPPRRAESVTSMVNVMRAVPPSAPFLDCVEAAMTFIFSLANTSEMSRSRPCRSTASTPTSTG